MPTFLNDTFKETYHSISGAEEEAFKKYAAPCKIKELAKKGVIRILDICFGIGYNTAATLDVALKENPDCKIEVVGLEADEEILKKIILMKTRFKNYGLLQEMVESNYELKHRNVHMKIIVGDARETVKHLKGEFDVCFFDPFSPARHPEMWSEEFLKDVGERIRRGGILATYSCATMVRINLVRAGFDVRDGPIVGRRSPATVAEKVY